jgi:peptidoglycan/xylan/chitin deacetylase (PgdA/CDA1 family)
MMASAALEGVDLMRAAIVGGIIAIVTLAAYGIVQAGWWPRVPAPQAQLSVPPGPAEAALAATAPAELASDSTIAPAEAPGDAIEAPVEVAANPIAVPAEPTASPIAAPAPVEAPAAVQVAAPATPAPIARPAIAAVAAPPSPAPAAPPTMMAQLAPAPIAPTIRPAGTPAAPVATPAAAAPAAVAAPAPPSAPALPAIKRPDIACANPNAMGVSRVVEIDTTGGPGFGSQHFKTLDFLRDHEVVLTFDDGPWLNNTPAVLKALADQCLRATFFPIGKHATYYPEILKQDVAAGHTIGSHTWSHADLTKKTPDEAKEEIEKGLSAVHFYAGAATAPFFRFPDLRHPPEMLTYLGQRNIATFSTDIDSFDFKIKKPDVLIKSLMGKLNKQGKGIILMHDFQKVTATALPELLGQLKANGFKIVHMVPKDQVTTLPQFDEEVLKDQKLPTVSNRPTSSVVRTISEVPGDAAKP